MASQRERQLIIENDKLRGQVATLRARWQVQDVHGKGVGFTKIVLRLITAATILGIVYIGATNIRGSIADTAGLKTDASFTLNSDVKVDISGPKDDKKPTDTGSLGLVVGLFGLIFGVGGIAYGRREASLRRDVIERFHKHQLEQELPHDPTRTSSRLTPSGDTRPEDL